MKKSKFYYYTIIVEGRLITICQAIVPKEFADGFIGIVTTIGIAIMNPMDSDSSLGRIIAKGRAERKPITNFTILSNSQLPKSMREAHIEWATLSIDKYVNKFLPKKSVV